MHASSLLSYNSMLLNIKITLFGPRGKHKSRIDGLTHSCSSALHVVTHYYFSLPYLAVCGSSLHTAQLLGMLALLK